jgi:hypothetical protein
MGSYEFNATGVMLSAWLHGAHAGRKVFTLQALPNCNEPFDTAVGKVAGFSLHAGVAARKDERKKLERLCRYIARPAVSEKQLSLLRNGHVRYELTTPYRDGATHVVVEPLDFIARLVALVPSTRPRVNVSDCFYHYAQLASVQRDRPHLVSVIGRPQRIAAEVMRER